MEDDIQSEIRRYLFGRRNDVAHIAPLPGAQPLAAIGRDATGDALAPGRLFVRQNNARRAHRRKQRADLPDMLVYLCRRAPIGQRHGHEGATASV